MSDYIVPLLTALGLLIGLSGCVLDLVTRKRWLTDQPSIKDVSEKTG